MSYREIHNMLDTQLGTIANLPTIVKANEKLSRTVDKNSSVAKASYIRTELVPAETETISMGLTGHDNFQGIFLIDIYIPSGDGVDNANWIADSIIAAYPKRTLITQNGITLRITNYTRGASVDSTNWFLVPMTIAWQSFIKRS